METNSYVACLVTNVNTTTTTNPHTVGSYAPTVTATLPATATASIVSVLPAYSKPFPNISRIEVFVGQNFKRWQERIYSTLDMHGVAWLLSFENVHFNTEA